MQTTTRGAYPEQSGKITVGEVIKRQQAGERFTFIDIRNSQAWGSSNTKLPGAIRMTSDDAATRLGELDKQTPIATYCT